MKEQVVLKNINDFENKSLLIVDDDNPFRERLARAMEKKGFEGYSSRKCTKRRRLC
jgi:two-component system response regulator RegA